MSVWWNATESIVKLEKKPEVTYYMNIGDRVQQLRKGMGLSQEQLADIVGVSRQAISKWETGQCMPDLDNIVLLSKTFSVSTDSLLESEQDTSKKAIKVESYIRSNLAKRLFTVGWITSLVGAVLLVIELFSLYYIKNMEIESAILRGLGYRQETWYYASQSPMSIIFIITGVIIVTGIAISIYSLQKQGKLGSNL